ncbi:MAG: tRNA (guanosine(46)-N7)-methyltransferase TrmB [Verrucomicrobiota bacterium]|nr:tRNA (guanosine(46)-N7)-methyltransferase TrmB [Verrucomicrobiota bacterium]
MNDQVHPTRSNAESLIFELKSLVERFDFRSWFPKDQPVEVELGSGDSGFIVERARLNPGRNFVGVERLLGRLRKLDRKGRRLGLTNLRGVRIEAAYCLEYLLPLGKVECLHVYFPDPWPKRRHRHRRLVNERFPSLARRVLVPGGRIYLRTDDTDYLEQMRSVFAANAEFRECETPDDIAHMTTEFEREFLAAGKRVWRLAYQCISNVDHRTVSTISVNRAAVSSAPLPNDPAAGPSSEKVHSK